VAAGVVAVSVLAMVLVGAGRLVAINAVPRPDGEVFSPPTPAQLSDLAARLQLPASLSYVPVTMLDDTANTRDRLVSRSRIPDMSGYALPGQYTRFLWHLGAEDRTVFWYVMADGTRPTTMDDRKVLTAEVPGNLTESEVGNQPGLLIVVPSSTYFDGFGDVAQFNTIQARAWIPWDPATHQLRLDTPRVFPLSMTLYDHERFTATAKQGAVAEAGPQRVVAGGPLLRAIALQPAETPENGRRAASISYSDVWLPPDGQFRASFALHPRNFLHAGVGPITLQVSVQSGDGQMVVAEQHIIDPLDKDHQTYQGIQLDLGAGEAMRRGSIEIRVLSETSGTEIPAVLVAEPRIVQP
jgi:hypothetical protein